MRAWALRRCALLVLSAAFCSSTRVRCSGAHCRYVGCLGDSITAQGDYPRKLEALLGGDKKWRVDNFGAGGRTAMRGQVRDYRLHPTYAVAKNFTAEVWVLMFGTNDARKSHWNARQFADDLEDLALDFQSLGGSVVLATPPPYLGAHLELGAPETSPINGELSKVISAVAVKRGWPFADVYAAFGGLGGLDKSMYHDDGVHLYVNGTDLVGTCVATQVAKAIVSPHAPTPASKARVRSGTAPTSSSSTVTSQINLTPPSPSARSKGTTTATTTTTASKTTATRASLSPEISKENSNLTPNSTPRQVPGRVTGETAKTRPRVGTRVGSRENATSA